MRSRRELILAGLLAAITFAVYWPAGRFDFVLFDDPQFIAENPQIKSGLSWATVVYAFSREVVGNWHPVTTLSHALDCQLFGLNAGAHHLVNAGWHALNAALLLIVLARLTGSTWRSALAAALFALHPLRVESVAWIAERKDVLSGFFFLLTIWAYGRYAEKAETAKPRAAAQRAQRELNIEHRTSNAELRRGEIERRASKPESGAFDEKAERAKAGSEHRSKDCGIPQSDGSAFEVRRSMFDVRCWALWGPRSSPAPSFALALVLFALGLMSKPMVVTLPCVLLLLDFWPLGRLQPGEAAWLKPLIAEKIPFFALSAVSCVITLVIQKGVGAMAAIRNIGLSDRVANAIESYWRYLGKCFWPANLSIVYPHPANHYGGAHFWPAWLLVVAFLGLVAISIGAVRYRWRAPWFAVGWFWYLGTLVPVIGLVQVGEQAMADRYTYLPTIGVVIALVWGAAALRAWLQKRFDGSSRRQEAQTSAVFDVDRSLLTSAATISKQALRQLSADSAPGRAGHGPGVDVAVGGPGGRERWCLYAQAAVWTAVVAGLAFLTSAQLPHWRSTVTLFRHALAATGANPSAEFALGTGLEREGDIEGALARYRAATLIDPLYSKANYNIGQIHRKQGRWTEAVVAYQAALKGDPNNPAIHLNLAHSLQPLGRLRDAAAQYERAIELDPKSTEGLNNLAWLLATSPDAEFRNGPRAVQLAERACELSDYKQPTMIGTLAAAYAEAGRFADAVSAAERAAAVADQSGEPAVAARNRELLQLYRAAKPYHEPPAGK